jgi:uroporphyrinogen decarboxylase
MNEVTPDFRRFLNAVNHKESDRVPLSEVLIEYPIQSRFLGREVAPDDIAAQVEFWSKAGYDYIPVPVSLMSPGKVTHESRITRVLKEMVHKKNPGETDDRAWNLEYTSFIEDRASFDEFPWEAAAEIDLSKIREVGSYLPKGMKAIAVSGKLFTLSWMLMGFNNFSIKLILEEDLVADVVAKVAEIQLSALDQIFSLDHVAGVWVVDDLAFGNGPMISPEAYRTHIFPWYRKIAERLHASGRIFLMHSDGDMSLLLPDLIEMGLDVLQPIDPTCMDIVKVKAEFGSKLCLVGNVSNELLRTGSPEEVLAHAIGLIKTVGIGGGFALGSGNSVPAWAKYENFLAMRKAALHFGNYPSK